MLDHSQVESLTAARQSALSGSEPSDAIRVVNALLTQLDQIKRHSNVIILTTSNITGAIDLAFVDRYTHNFIVPPLYITHVCHFALLTNYVMCIVGAELISSSTLVCHRLLPSSRYTTPAYRNS